MKKFILTGPETSISIDVEDDEMLQWKVIKIKDYEATLTTCEFCNKQYEGFHMHCPHCSRKPKGLQEVGG